MRPALPVLAVLIAAAWAAFVPHRLVDGDSCLHAAIARDMAEGGASAWVAPRWAHQGAWTWYREQPPGGFWGAALFGRLLDAEAAARLSNLLATVLAAWGVGLLARRWLGLYGAWTAALVFLLHAPVLRAVQRFALEPALAAATVWTVVAALRLRGSRAWVAVLAFALAAAFLVRGVFGGVALGLLVVCALDPALRPPWRRLLAGVLLAALAVLAFDRAHAAVTGEGFWGAYLARQVLPSLESGGGAHGREQRQFVYFTGRLLLYALPWALLIALRLIRRGPRPAPEAWRLLGVWILGTWLGASLTVRPASRYLFAAWPATAVLAALAWPALGTLGRRVARVAPLAAVLALLLPLAIKTADGRDRWTRSADRLAARRVEAGLPAAVRGPFDPEDARLKSLIRLHLGVPALSGPPESGDWRWVPPGAPAPEGAPVLEIPLGRFYPVP